MNKKNWETPQLIILARGKPEEILTTGCKEITPMSSGSNGYSQDGCCDPADTYCGSCQARNGSIS